MEAVITEWTDRDHITVKTADGKTYSITYRDFLSGKRMGAKKRIHRSNAASHIGETVKLSLGMSAKIIKYTDHNHITAKRSDGRIFHPTYENFRKGIGLGMQIAACDKARENWIGQIYKLYCGCIATVIEAAAWNDITIRTDTGYVKHHVHRQHLKEGNVGIPKDYWPENVWRINTETVRG